VELPSAAGLAGVAAAALEAAGADPEVAGDVAQLGAEGHRLGEVVGVFARGVGPGVVRGEAGVAHGGFLFGRRLKEGLVVT
jgi:hypothetical protein